MFGPNSILIALGGVLLAVLAAFFKGRLSGAKAERTKVEHDRIEARDVADQVDNDIGALPADLKRKELGTWRRK